MVVSSLRLKYGLDKATHHARFVYEVPKGLDCHCVCPICGEDLIARKGDVRVHHFAHRSGADCQGARAAMLHKLVQEVIAEEKTILLPPFNKQFVHQPARLVTFDDVSVATLCKDENKTHQPDCVGTVKSEGIEIAIEISCTTRISKTRREEISSQQRYYVEIDFAKILNTDYTKETIKEKLLTRSYERWWIWHPVWSKEEAEKAEEHRKREEEEQRRKEAQHKREQEERMRLIAQKLKSEPVNPVPPKKEETPITLTSWQLPSMDELETFWQKQTEKPKDWLQDVNGFQLTMKGREEFYQMMEKEYASVSFANSHPLVVEHAQTKINELLRVINKDPDLLQPETKIYLEYMLVIWVLEQLNKQGETALSQTFVENPTVRNTVLRTVKQIGSISTSLDWQQIIRNAL